MKVSSTKHFGLLGLLTLFLLLVIQPVAAQVIPSMNLYVNWTPDEQLTSFDEDVPADGIQADEERFVSAQIYINGNVQFWAIDVSCRIGTGAELELMDVTFPTETWGTFENDYFVTPSGGNAGGIAARYNQPVGGGTLAFTLTRVGNTTTPVGTNGVNYTLPIANVRFRVENRTADALVPTTCTVIRFLDRNGRQVMIGRQATFTQLFVRIGYTLRGTAYRQGATNHSNILVTCTHNPHLAPEFQTTYTAYTLINGAFVFGGAVFTTQTANHLRDFGLYECIYESDFDRDGNTAEASDNNFLRSVSYINLTTPKYQLMPVTVLAGDFERTNSPDTINVLDDLDRITGNFNTIQTIFTNGDANGDTRVNQNDLALVASNVDLSDDPDPISAEHVLYSLGTDYNTLYLFPNSRVQMGTPESGAIERRNRTSATRDFWATLSPDGSEYAYISQNRITRVHSLLIGNMVNGLGVPFRLPIGFQYPEAFAPSWSPDGGMLAWICSYTDTNISDLNSSSYLTNEGALCYANRGDLRANTVTVVDNHVDSIFPPAWWSYQYNGDTFYAIVYSDGGQLYYYDLRTASSNTVGALTSNADMPVIINHWTGDSYLFYRFDTGASYQLRVAKLTQIPSATFSATATGLTFGPVSFATLGNSGDPDGYHMVIDDTADVQYYDVSQFLDIMLYADRSGFNTTNVYFGAAPIATPDLSSHFWTAGDIHYVDGNIGGPTEDSLGAEWDGDMSNDTFFHVYRVTFDWVP